MATTILLVLAGLTALVTLFWVVLLLAHAYHLRRSIRSGRLLYIKTLYGLHFQRRAFTIAGKR